MNGFFARARSLWRGLRRPEQLEAEMDEEMRFHLEMEAERLVRERGLDPREARRQAAIAFGGVEKYKEARRDVRGLTRVSGMALDFKLGARMLVKYPGLSVVGGLGMAVAIAIGAGVFSFVAAVVDPALPLDEGGRVVAIQNVDVAASDTDRRTHLHDLAAWRQELPAVQELGASRTVDRNLVTADGRAEPLRVAEMTASGFRIARVPPRMGRYFHDADERAGAPPVVVIGHGVWKNRFGGSPDVVGRTLRLGNVRHTVVGVMPEGFAFPVNNRLWTPLRLDAAEYDRGRAPAIDVFGRLAPSVTLAQARAQLETVGRRMAAAHPATHRHVRPRILPYTRSFIDSPELLWAFYLLQLVVAMLLVVIAANVAILVYARTATRMGEIAVRFALGASRARVVTQLFAEALVLAAAAAAAGLVAAGFALRQVNAFVARMGGEQVPFWWSIGLSSGTVLYATGMAVVAAVIVGVLPALRTTGPRVQATLRELGGATGMRMGKTWTVLIVAQVAIAVTVLPVAVAVAWTELFPSATVSPVPAAHELLSAGLGMDVETRPGAEAAAYERELAARFADRHAELVKRLEGEPGVAAVTFASALPGGAAGALIEVESRRPAAEPARAGVSYLQVDPGLFGVFGVRVLAGRPFHAADPSGTAVIANRSFVEQVLGGGEALGRRFRYTRNDDPAVLRPGAWYEIVGVVGDFSATEYATGRGVATLYHPATPARLNPLSLIVRVQGVPPESFAGRLRGITASLDPTLRLYDVVSVAQMQRQEQRTRRLMTLALGVATLSVLLFSAAGIHALMSFTVANRRREIGIRTALGAHPRRILAGIFSRALRQLGAGVAVGCLAGGALMVGGGATPARAAVLLLTVALLMLAVGLLAALGPARRGLRLQPMEALREG